MSKMFLKAFVIKGLIFNSPNHGRLIFELRYNSICKIKNIHITLWSKIKILNLDIKEENIAKAENIWRLDYVFRKGIF